MSETEARLNRLERQVRRLRGLVVGVGLARGRSIRAPGRPALDGFVRRSMIGS